MQRYLEQLIGDIHQATWNMKPPHELWADSEADPDDELELEDMSYVEKCMYGDEAPISEITGIDHEQLPSVEKLTQEQQAILAEELEKLLHFFHFHLDFPENYPAHLRYPFILKFWEGKQVALSFGENHIELCDYEEENCPFPGYCNTCKEVAAELKYDEENYSKADFDFNIDVNNLLPSTEEIEKWAKEQGIENDTRELDEIFGVSESNDPFPKFITGGFFNDDGTPINPKTVPVPSLCMVCKSFYIDDPEEKFLCMMNRNDQRNDPDFICGAFEKL